MDTPKSSAPRAPVDLKDQRMLAVFEDRLRHEILDLDEHLKHQDRVVKLRRRLGL